MNELELILKFHLELTKVMVESVNKMMKEHGVDKLVGIMEEVLEFAKGIGAAKPSPDELEKIAKKWDDAMKTDKPECYGSYGESSLVLCIGCSYKVACEEDTNKKSEVRTHFGKISEDEPEPPKSVEELEQEPSCYGRFDPNDDDCKVCIVKNICEDYTKNLAEKPEITDGVPIEQFNPVKELLKKSSEKPIDLDTAIIVPDGDKTVDELLKENEDD